MPSKTYAFVIAWSEEDEAFLAKTPDCPLCTAHGDTRVEAVEQLEIAIENYLTFGK